MAQVKNAGRLLDFEDVAAFNEVIDSNTQLKAGLDRLARNYSEMTKQEYMDEMLLLFQEAGIFLTESELEKLLLLRQQMDRMLLERQNLSEDTAKKKGKT